MRSHLSPLDAALLEVEQGDEAAHMHFGWALVCDPLPGGERPSLGALREQVRQRLVADSTLRRRLSIPTVGRHSLPIWLPDPDLDVGRLVSGAMLPQPGGEAELIKWLGDYFSGRVDRSRPLWEATLLGGLEGGRWALVCKVHHCLIDGISGACLVGALLDAAPEPDETRLLQMIASLGPEEERGFHWRLRGAVGEEASGGIDATVHPGEVVSIVSEAREMAERLVREELRPVPPTSLNGPSGGSRRIASLNVPLEATERINRELGGGLNEVVLSIVAGGLQRLFEQRGEEVKEVSAMVPLSIQRASESLVLGDQAAPFFLGLPVSDPDPVRRYRRVLEASEKMRRGQVADAEALVEAAALEPALVQSVFTRLAYTPGLFNLTITHVPTAPLALTSLGARMRRVIPAIPLFSGHNLAVGATAYDDRLHLGLIADHDAVPDLEIMRAGMEQALTELALVAA